MTRTDLIRELLELNRRATELEDIARIETLHRTFVRAVADRQFELLPEFFTPDATIDMRRNGVRTGTAEIREHFSHMVNVPLSGAGYQLSSPVVTVSGEQAQGSWTWHRFQPEAQQGPQTVRVWGVWQEGRYRCRYRKTADGWKFETMHFRVVLPDPDDEPGHANAAGKDK